MAMYYKFKSEKDDDSIPMSVPFMSVGELKRILHEKKELVRRYRRTDFDTIIITNALTDEDYPDNDSLIQKNTHVVIRRTHGLPRLPIVLEMNNSMEAPATESLKAVDSSRMEFEHEDFDYGDFGNLYETPKALPATQPVKSHQEVSSSDDVDKKNKIQALVNNLTLVVPPKNDDEIDKIQALVNKPTLVAVAPPKNADIKEVQALVNSPAMVAPSKNDDEIKRIQALVNTPAMNWQSIDGDKRSRRKLTWRNFGMQSRTPPVGYVCYRCKTPGHFIQFCPTNGDPEYDIKKVKPAVVKPYETVFEKEMEGISSRSSSSGELPLELLCPLCMKVMKDAMMTTKCCFRSFCYKCIWDHIVSKSKCFCGVVILTDDLVPNLSVRDQINRIMSSDSGSSTSSKSSSVTQDQESAKSLQLKCLYQNSSRQTEERESNFYKADSKSSNCKRKSEHLCDHEESNRLKKFCPGS